jgi:hypothetical protein
MVSYHAAQSEEDDLKDFIKRHNPDAEVFIHENPQEDKLKNHGWERVPFNWRGKQIWIQRKPKSDKKALGASA